MVVLSQMETLKSVSYKLNLNEFPGVPGAELEDLISYYLDIYNPTQTLVLSTGEGLNIVNALKGREDGPVTCIVNLKRINDVRWINQLYETTNKSLPEGGVFVGCVETYGLRKQRILRKYPRGFNYLYYTGDYLVKRVFPKLPILKKLYFLLTRGQNRSISMAEAFGRLYFTGFELIEYKTIGSNLYFVAKKTRTVSNVKTPTYGPLFRMNRVGKGGKMIEVYKLRSMHAYSEYLQEYLYQRNNLQDGGKIKNDFRISTLGRYLRKSFLDEVPMLYNILKGDLKLVGVRPISAHYLSLYDKELRLMRRTVKPGLVPPFYADMPKTIEEIIESEKNYIRAYIKNPLKTDVIYFFKAFANIAFRKARSN
ncbi:MAG: sugar transferase [Flavobacteriales bacterium]|nr:sugar transferase [Flavobacteriales bacterium]